MNIFPSAIFVNGLNLMPLMHHNLHEMLKQHCTKLPSPQLNHDGKAAQDSANMDVATLCCWQSFQEHRLVHAGGSDGLLNDSLWFHAREFAGNELRVCQRRSGGTVHWPMPQLLFKVHLPDPSTPPQSSVCRAWSSPKTQWSADFLNAFFYLHFEENLSPLISHFLTAWSKRRSCSKCRASWVNLDMLTFSLKLIWRTLENGNLENNNVIISSIKLTVFLCRFVIGDRPPAPRKSFRGHWNTRCEPEWRRAFFMFSIGEDCSTNCWQQEQQPCMAPMTWCQKQS